MATARIILISAFALIFSSCGSSDKKPQIKYNSPFTDFVHVKDAPEALTNAANSVVMINNASGFFISDSGLLMTNNHVLGEDSCSRKGCIMEMHTNLQRGRALEYESKKYYFEPKFADGILDFSIYQVYTLNDEGKKDSPYYPEAFLSIAKPTSKIKGANIFLIGHPARGLKKFSSGKVSHIEGHNLHMNAFAVGGNSGGAIVDESGKFVGILHSSQRDTHFMSRRGLQVHSWGTTVEAIIKSLGASSSDIQVKFADEKNSSIEILSDLKTKDADDLIGKRYLFFSSRTIPIDLPGMKPQQNFLNFLMDECRASLNRDHAKSLHTLESRISERCFSFIDWTNCQEDESKEFGFCPEDSTKKELVELVEEASARVYDINASIAGWHVYKIHFYLEKSKSAGIKKGKTAVKSYLARMKLPLSMEVASLKVWHGTENFDYTYNGTDLVEYVMNFQTNVDSPSDYNFVLNAARGMTVKGQTKFTSSELGKIYEMLLSDENTSFTDFSYIEKTAFLDRFID